MAANDPSREVLADWGTLVLRVSLGVLIFLHGIAKVIGGPAFVTGLVAKAGLPPALGTWSTSERW
jgi:putative oxidoreductase